METGVKCRPEEQLGLNANFTFFACPLLLSPQHLVLSSQHNSCTPWVEKGTVRVKCHIQEHYTEVMDNIRTLAPGIIVKHSTLALQCINTTYNIHNNNNICLLILAGWLGRASTSRWSCLLY